MPNSPGAGRKLQPGPGCGCHGYTATTLRTAVLLRRMSLSRSRVFPGVCTKAHEGVFQGAPRGGAHTSPPFFNLMVIQIKDCQRFVSIVFVDSPHSSNEDHVKLDFPISLSVQAISMLCCAFAFWSRGSGLVSSHNLNSIR